MATKRKDARPLTMQTLAFRFPAEKTPSLLELAQLRALLSGPFVYEEAELRLRQLIVDYRRQLNALRQAEWPPTTHGFSHLIHCPPSYGRLYGSELPCRRSTLCPFCWSRLVTAELYRSLTWAAYGSRRVWRLVGKGLKQQIPARQLELVEYSYQVFYQGQQPLAQILQEEQAALLTQRRWLRRYKLGYWFLTTVEPADRGQWLATRRAVLAIRPSMPEAYLRTAPPQARLHRHTYPLLREELCLLTARMAAYPQRLLSADAVRVRALLDARSPAPGKHFRLLRTQGLLRNGHLRRQARRQANELMDRTAEDFLPD